MRGILRGEGDSSLVSKFLFRQSIQGEKNKAMDDEIGDFKSNVDVRSFWDEVWKMSKKRWV